MRAKLLFAAAVLAGFAAALAFGAPSGASPAPRRYAPWAMAATADGRRLFVACGRRPTVVEIDVPAPRVAREIDVGGTPRGLALSPDGATLAVSIEPQDEVVLLDAASGRVTRRIAVGKGPERLAFSADGRRLFVALRIDEEVASVLLGEGRVEGRVRCGREPFALALSPDGRTIAVASRHATVAPPDEPPSAEVTLLDAATLAVTHRVPLPSMHMSEALAFTPDGRDILVPGLRVRNLLPVVQVARGWVVSGVVALVDAARGDASILPLTMPARGFADPGGIAVLHDVPRVFVASGGGNEVGILDRAALLAARDEGRPGRPENLALASRWLLRRVATGWNPRGVVRVPAAGGDLVAISERLDDRILFLDADGTVVSSVDLGRRPPPDALLRGERAFHDASYCFQGAFACRSCHPEAHSDGLTYDFEIDGVGKDIVLNRSLRGLAGTAPFKWSGLNPTLQRQCGARFAMVLTRARVIPADRLDDLAAWLFSLPPPRPPIDAATAPPDVRAAIDRGRRIFERSRDTAGRRLRPAERCISCHPPPLFTNREVADVGTGGPYDESPLFDVPHLRGIGRGGPFLHDGRALTLEDIWRGEGAGDAHGKVSDLSPQAFSDLVTYLRSL